MKNKLRKRDYKMSDADLVQLSDIFKLRGIRDLAELSRYKLDVAWFADFSTKRDIFAATESDVALMGDVTTATQKKDAARELLLDAIRDIAGIAKIVFKENDGKYRSFGVEDLSNQSDNEVSRIATGVATRALMYFSEMEVRGLTQEDLDNFALLKQDFDNKIDAKRQQVFSRDISANARIAHGNALYEMLVMLADIGKLYWASRNEAKYNDYIIYKNIAKQAPQFETEGTVVAMSGISTSVSGISDNTEITLKNTSDVPLQFFFAQEPTDISAPTMISINPKTKEKHTAKALGFKESTGFSRLNVFNDSAAEGSFTILWD